MKEPPPCPRCMDNTGVVYVTSLVSDLYQCRWCSKWVVGWKEEPDIPG
jgi:hypothetical protein